MKKRLFFISTFLITATLFLIPFLSHASVVINEVAWMGTAVSASNEWIELYNNGGSDVDLSGWTLTAVGGVPNINFSSTTNKIIPAGGFYLLERTDDTTVPNIAADLIYTGALSNDGETLILKEKTGSEMDRVTSQGKWLAGDNLTKQTMQKLIGGGWITAIATPKAANAFGGQSAQSSSSANSQITQQNQSESNTSGVANWPTEPQIFANAGENKTVIAGADVLFEGKALGLKKEPLENARYLWNFGDWTSAEGKNVRHFYKNTGEYIAVLDVSSGQYSTSDRVNVKIVPNELYIADANSEFIKLKNKSNILLDISGWFLKAGDVLFRSPDSSLIMANAELIISADISKIKFTEGSSLDLLYPNGSVVFSYKKEIKMSSSISSTAATNTSEIAAVKTISASFPKRNFENVHKGNSPASSSGNLPAASSTLQSNNQAVSVIYVAESSKSGWKNWLYLALFLGLFAGGGLFFIKRTLISH